MPGSEFEMACDSVIMALGTSPNPLLRKATPDLEYSDRGGIVVQDDTVTTMKDGVFAGGDCVTGPATAIRAIAAGKVAAATLRLNIGRYELPPDEDTCYLLLVSEGSVTLEYEGGNVLVNPGSAVLLGPGGCRFAQTGSAVPQIVGCHFPLGMLHDLKNTAGRDFSRLFAPGERTVLYAPVQWQSRIRTLLEMMASASTEQDYPGPLYLLLILHYVEQECIAESSAVARPHNETVEQICAYLAANYRQKFSLTEVAAQFYLSPYYLSRLFRRVTGQSIVDYINNRRIEAAQKLLETTELSISAVAEQTGFASAAHFRRVFREVMGTGPLQYRKGHKK